MEQYRFDDRVKEMREEMSGGRSEDNARLS